LIQEDIFNQGLLSIIYKLTGTDIKVKEVGKHADSIIDYILNNENSVSKIVFNHLKKIRDDEIMEKKKMAERKKMEVLKSLGLAKPPISKMEVEGEPKKKPDAMNILSNFSFGALEEEKSIACIVCHEGYSINPTEILGVYIYSKPCRIPDQTRLLTDGIIKETNGITSVTHFNAIHLKCHTSAARAERAMKKPKNEWEGAIIRNSHTKVKKNY
jgi:E3 ubiquitin-protein ligase UBR4